MKTTHIHTHNPNESRFLNNCLHNTTCMRPICMNNFEKHLHVILTHGLWTAISMIEIRLVEMQFSFSKWSTVLFWKGNGSAKNLWLLKFSSRCIWKFLGTTHENLFALYFVVAFLGIYEASTLCPRSKYLWLILSFSGRQKKLYFHSLPSLCLTARCRVTFFTGFYIQIKGHLEFILKVHTEHIANLMKSWVLMQLLTHFKGLNSVPPAPRGFSLHRYRKLGINEIKRTWIITNCFEIQHVPIGKGKKGVVVESPCKKEKTQWVVKRITIILSPPTHQITWGRGRNHLSSLNFQTASAYLDAKNDRDLSHRDIWMFILQPHWFKARAWPETPRQTIMPPSPFNLQAGCPRKAVIGSALVTPPPFGPMATDHVLPVADWLLLAEAGSTAALIGRSHQPCVVVVQEDLGSKVQEYRLPRNGIR